ncbi:prefoldin subunit alpha [archaeon]|jgi:prefoldin alpha subunit|nr:prefoldin subunit alpha [archaeon]MBT4352766.1 prefoldin subunit alpha [archaeon]MBT4646989.1 prefoldin subunit alpha [archaeon]MBT6822584.1 prefoldin subunit alpha [archaeon]MBT7392769.1 prefoldin subunit alpha [archaeon]
MSDKLVDQHKQELYSELQMLDQQIKQVQVHMEKLDEQLAEIVSVNVILEDIKDVKKGTETMVPIANGVYIKTKIEDTDDLLVNVGANTIVSKKIPEVKEMILQQETEIKGYKEKILGNFQVLIKRVEDIQEELKK